MSETDIIQIYSGITCGGVVEMEMVAIEMDMVEMDMAEMESFIHKDYRS